jgi:K+-transporting ATPase ATPase A chain
MTSNGWLQIAVFFTAILAVTPPLGRYMTHVFNGRRTWLDPVLRPLERAVYALCRVDERHEMRWTEYCVALLGFSAVSMLLLYLLQRLQGLLPFNPQGLGAVPSHSAFNTAVSFTTNTNWQSYVPETTMSYLSQMAGLSYQNFVSAAAGIALAIALVRGISRRESDTIGNFWVDLTRAWLWVLLPFCLVGALVLVSQGVVQNLRPYATVQLVDPPMVTTTDDEGRTTKRLVRQQVIAQGPVASQEFIKLWGTNGGGYFNANSAHPFENPTPLTNFIGLVAIFAIPAALTWTLGEMTRSRRHGWAVWAAMGSLFIVGASVTYWAEAAGNPLLVGVDQRASALQPGGNMEGKEVRFGIASSALFATVTTDASCGAVNSMHDSYTPLGGMVPLVNIMLGEVIFGGVGAGMYGMLVFVVLTVFIAGLMVGRTPEYLGKKIEAFDVKMAMLAVLVPPVTALAITAIAVVSPGFGTSSILNPGPHGLSEILYAYTSGAGNNGSSFAGLSANTGWYNVTTGFAMLVGRFLVIVPMLAMAGNLARKTRVPASTGTFPVTTPLFATLLVFVVVIVGALTFFPALSLGPIVEHLLMGAGTTY